MVTNLLHLGIVIKDGPDGPEEDAVGLQGTCGSNGHVVSVVWKGRGYYYVDVLGVGAWIRLLNCYKLA